MTRELLRETGRVLRGMRRRPGVPAAVVLSLGVGLAVSGAAWQMLEAVFFYELPVEQPDRLVAVYGTDAANPGFFPVSHPNFEDLRDGVRGRVRLAAYQWTRTTLTDRDPPERLYGQIVSPDFFEVLGLPLLRGRTFGEGEERAPVVVVGRGLARRSFGGAEAALGKTLALNGRPYTVIGVAAAGFHGVGAMGVLSELWVPMWTYPQVSALPDSLERRDHRMFGLVGRLRDGAPSEQSRTLFLSEGRRLETEHPEANRGLGLEMAPLSHSGLDPNQREKYVLGGRLMAGVALLLLLTACANASTLLQIRALARRRDHAVRLALGARTRDVLTGALIESTLLALGGGALGLALTAPLLQLVWHRRPPFLAEGSLQMDLGWNRVLVVLALSLLAALAVAAVPAFQARRRDLVRYLAGALGHARAGRPAWLDARGSLVVLQVVFGTVALVTALLFVRSLTAQTSLDLGFETEDRLLADVDLRSQEHSNQELLEVHDRVLHQVGRLGGVRRAALAAYAPLAPYSRMRSLEIEGGGSGDELLIRFNVVSDGYFEALGLRLLAGRDLEPRDRSGPWVAVVNETLADRFWPGESPLGKRFTLGDDERAHEVVGVVENAVYVRPGEEPQPYAYLHLAQHPAASLVLHAWTSVPPETLSRAVSRELRATVPEIAPAKPRTLEDRLRDTLWTARLAAASSAVLGAFCLGLVAVGVLSTVAYLVGQRRRELAIRIVLGSRRRSLVATVLRRNLVPVAWGLVLGLGLAAGLARTFAGLLVGVQPWELGVYAAALGGIGAVSAAAALLPAWRASRVEPRTVLG